MTTWSIILSLWFSAPAQAATLHVRMSGAPVNLDWNGPATTFEAPLILNLCEGLFTYDYSNGALIPGIAESVKKSKDLTEYTFKIKKTAKWSDGRAIYAQDFVDAWTRLLSPQSTSIYTYYLFDVMNAKEFNSKKVQASSLGFKAVDDRTLVVKLKRPSQSWEAVTAFWPLFPVRRDQIEKYGANWWRAGVLISSGPFIFDSYETGKKITFKRNPHYPKGKSNITEVLFEIIVDPLEAIKQYEAGHFSFLWGVSTDQIAKVKNKSEIKTQKLMRIHSFGLNTEKYPMTNRDFRLAVLKGIDPSKLIPESAKQLTPIRTMIPPPLPGSSVPTNPNFNLSEAREHLKKSGVIVTKSTQLSILTSISEPYASIGRLIQNQLAQNLGLNVEVSTQQNQEYTAYMGLGDYNATLTTWTGKVLSPQDFLLPYSGEAAYNILHFKNAFFDQWMFEGMRATNASSAQDSFHRAQKLMSQDEGVFMPLFVETGFNLMRSNIRNLYFNHMGIPIVSKVVISKK